MNRIFKHFKEGFLGVVRNLALSMSSVSSVTITLLLMGMFLFLSANIDAITKRLEQSVQIHVTINYDHEAEEQIEAIENQIRSIDQVLDVEFSDKDQEFEYWIALNGSDQAEELYGEYRGENNPMRHAFLVTVREGQYIEDVAAQIRDIEGVFRSSAGGSGTGDFMSALTTIRDVGFVVVIALSVIAVFLISNTIRVSIHSRRREISIMRSVGATNWYIRWPFIIEGMIIGLVGSIIPILVSIFGYQYLLGEMRTNFLAGTLGLLPVDPLAYEVSLVLVGIGVLVGALGSLFSVGKFLRWSR